MSDLSARLLALDGRNYPAYKALARRRFPLGDGGAGASLVFDHVQGDPFAAPSRVRVELDPDAVGLPDWATAGGDARRATSDYLHRRLRRALGLRRDKLGSGMGKISDTHLLVMACLTVADELSDAYKKIEEDAQPILPVPSDADETAFAQAIDGMAARLESVAERLENI